MIKVDNRYQAFALHLVLSLVMLAILLGIIFFYWYPYDFIKTGGSQGLKILAGVDLVLGPLLTLIVFNPNKKKLLLKIDLSLIALVQFSCMAAGVWLIHKERPLVQLLADNGVHILAKADYDNANKDIGEINLPGSSPKFAVLNFPMDLEQLNVMKFAGDFMGEPYNLEPSRYRAPGELSGDDMAAVIGFIQEQLSPDDKTAIQSLPKREDCIWLPIVSVHFRGFGCTSTSLGVLELMASP